MSKTAKGLVGLFVSAGLLGPLTSNAFAEDYLGANQHAASGSWFGAYGGIYGSYGGQQSRQMSGETRYVAPEDNIDPAAPDIINQTAIGGGSTAPALRNTLAAPLDRSDLIDLFDIGENKEVGVVLGLNIPVAPQSRVLLGVEASLGYSIQSRDSLQWTNTQDITYNEDPANSGDLLRGTVAESLQVNSDPYDFNGEFVARAGYLVTDNVMLFGLGGIGFRNVKYDLAYDATATLVSDDVSGNLDQVQDTTGRLSISDGQWTWIAGLGAEYMLSESLRLRGEYRYSYAEGKSYDVTVTPTSTTTNVAAADPSTSTMTVDDMHNHAFRVSLVVPFNSF